jgi:hypothetical protein
LFFEGSVPLSISLIVRHKKMTQSSGYLEDDIREKFGLQSPPKLRQNTSNSQALRSGDISVYWTYDKGEPGLREMGRVSDLSSPIVGFFKLKYSQVLIITLQKLALVYGKSYNANGAFQPVILTSTDLSRYLGKQDKILECLICNKEFFLIKYQAGALVNLENIMDQ